MKSIPKPRPRQDVITKFRSVPQDEEGYIRDYVSQVRPISLESVLEDEAVRKMHRITQELLGGRSFKLAVTSMIDEATGKPQRWGLPAKGALFCKLVAESERGPLCGKGLRSLEHGRMGSRRQVACHMDPSMTCACHIPLKVGDEFYGTLRLGALVDPDEKAAFKDLEPLAREAGIDLKALRESWRDIHPVPTAAREVLLSSLEVVVTEAIIRRRDIEAQLRVVELQKQEIHRLHGASGIVGDSPAISHARERLLKLKDSEVSVLITGESGSGKEVFARALHMESPRRAGPFVGENCAALPRDLVESHLFGHAKGAFTGAHEDRQGLFLQADGGTLFLDEIAEMDLDLQAKLLRAIETRRCRPVGGKAERSFDVRLLCATHQNLAQLVRKGRFREDLYFRINVVELKVPPLRERREDVPLLAEHFLSHEGHAFPNAFTSEGLERMKSAQWPGNVRQLRNAISRLALLHPRPYGDEAVRGVLSDLEAGTSLSSPRGTLRQVKEDAMIRALEETGGNIRQAALKLKVAYATMHGFAVKQRPR